MMKTEEDTKKTDERKPTPTIEDGIDTSEDEGLSVDDLELDFEYEDDTSDEDGEAVEDLNKKKDTDEEDVDEGEGDDVDDEGEEPDTTDKDDTDDDEGDEEGEDPRIVDDIIKRTGLEFTEEELDGIEDTEDGIVNLTEKIANKRAEQMLNDYMEKHPLSKQLMEFEQKGGDPEQFKEAFLPEVDYQSVKIDEKDTAKQKEIIKASLKDKGFSDERIERNIELYEDGGMLLDEANDALKELRTSQKEQKEQLVKQQEEQFQKAQEQAKEIWKEVEETINTKDDFNNIPLTKKDKAKFFEFLTPNEEGVSERDQRAQDLSLEDQLTIDLILFHGLDTISDIINRNKDTEKTKTLKEKLKKNKSRNKTDKREDSKPGNVDDLEFRLGE